MDNFNDYNYLCHYGILGMKWGVRRYQNPNGSLTAAGKTRYADDNIKGTKRVPVGGKSGGSDIMTRKYPRNRAEKKEMKKRDNAIREEYFNAVNKKKEELNLKYKAKEENLWNEMNEITKKYSFDLDDGGNARTKEDSIAARRYMDIWDEIDGLEDKKFAEAKKVAEKYIHTKYGDIGSSAIKNASPFVSFGKKKY